MLQASWQHGGAILRTNYSELRCHTQYATHISIPRPIIFAVFVTIIVLNSAFLLQWVYAYRKPLSRLHDEGGFESILDLRSSLLLSFWPKVARDVGENVLLGSRSDAPPEKAFLAQHRRSTLCSPKATPHPHTHPHTRALR